MGNNNIGDINLNINVNVRGAAGLQAINTGLANIQATGARATKSLAGATSAMATQKKVSEGLKGRLDAAETAYDAIFRASYRLQNVGYGLINVSRKMFGVLKELTEQWGSFEFMVNRAAGAMQIWQEVGGRANPIYEALIENVYSLSKELRLFPAEDVAKATYFWASTTGQQVDSLNDLKVAMKAVNPLMKIAALTETSYEQAIKGVYSILIQYHKGLEQTEDVTAKLHLVTQRTALEFGDLINSFKYVGPTAGALGVTFEEVAQTLGAIGDAGIRGTMAGRALRQMFIQTARPTAKARDLLNNVFRNTKELGKGFEDLIFPEGKFVGITKMSQYLAIALKDATVRERQFFLASITTANELPVLTALVENQIRVLHGAADAYDMTKASVDDANSAQRQFQKSWELLASSWKGVVGRLRAGAEVIRLRVGRQIAEALKPAVAQFTEFLDGIEKWVKRNPEMVSTLGRATAALGGLAAVAGGLFILAGALLGLYAAVNVITRGFAPLFAIGSATLGMLVALGEAVIENWTRIQRVIVPAVNRLMYAITGGRGGIELFREEFDKLHESIRNIANFVVRTAIVVIERFLDLLTSIANSPLRPFLEGVGQALIAAFGIRAIGALLGFGRAINMAIKAVAALAILFRAGAITTAIQLVFLPLMTRLSAALAIVRAGAISTAIQLKLLGTGAMFSVTGIRAMATALTTLSKTSVLLIITGVVFAIDLLKSILPDATKNLDELSQSYKDFIFEVGEGGKRLDAEIQSLIGLTPRIAAMQAEVDRLREKYASGTESFADPENARDWERYNDLQKEVARLTMISAERAKEWADSFQAVADEAERGLGEVVDIFHKYGPKIFGSLNSETAIKSAQAFTKEYFKALGEDSVISAKKAVELWNNLVAQGIKPNVSAASFLNLVVPKEELRRYAMDLDAQLQLDEVRKAMQERSFDVATNILIGLKAGADTYSDDINSEVTRLLNGIPKGFSAVMEEVEALATKGPGEILTALVDGFKSLGDVQAKIEAALKRGPVTKDKIVKALIGDISGPATTKALNGKFNELILIGQAAVDNAHTQFVNAVAAYEKTGKSDALAKEIQKQFGPEKFKAIFFGTYAGKDWTSLTDEQRAGLQEFVDWAATQLGLVKPSPDVVSGVQKQLSGKAAQLFRMEFGDLPKTPAEATGIDPISQLVKEMKDPWEKSGKPFIDQVGDYFQTTFENLSGWFDAHPDPLSNLAEAMNASLTMPNGVFPTTDRAAQYIKDHLAGNSPPPMGPLSTIDKGGLAVMMAWIGGLMKGIPIASAVATLAAVRVFLALGVQPVPMIRAGGFNIMKAWVDGMMNYWSSRGRDRLISVLRQIKAMQIGASPPREGPLRDIDKGGYNIGKAWADGMMRGSGLAVSNALTTASMVRSALSLDGPDAPSLAMSARSERTIRVEIDVASKDGSIDTLTVQQLKNAITSDDLVRSLQHMAAAKG